MGSSKQNGLFLLAFCVTASYCAEVPVAPCDNLGSTGVNVSDVALDNLYLGEQMTMRFRLNTNRVLTSPDLRFQIVAANHDVPCNAETEAGSCTYSLCGRRTYQVEGKICTAWRCVCPIQPGSYMDPAGLQLTLPSFDGLIGRVITRSDTKVTLRLSDAGTPLFCGAGSVRVQQRKNKAEDDSEDFNFLQEAEREQTIQAN